MTSADNKIFQFNQYQTSYKAPFIIYANLESFSEKIDGCKNNPENLSITKKVNIFRQVSQVLQYLQYHHVKA